MSQQARRINDEYAAAVASEEPWLDAELRWRIKMATIVSIIILALWGFFLYIGKATADVSSSQSGVGYVGNAAICGAVAIFFCILALKIYSLRPEEIDDDPRMATVTRLEVEEPSKRWEPSRESMPWLDD